MNSILTEIDSRTGKKTLSPIYALLRNRRRPESCKATSEPEPKSIPAQTPKAELTPAISSAQQKAIEDLKQYKVGVRGSLGYTPQVTTEKVEPPRVMTFEEQIISDWKNDPGIRAEFVSLSSYQAYMKAQREGKAKIHQGSVVK